MKLYRAIDLHSTNNVTVVIDEQDRVVYQKRLPNVPPLMKIESLREVKAKLSEVVKELPSQVI